ncbi:MAG: hypothetical protein KatS3mg102_2901 [Planctomycetota bacterium]|nr:MAG: hypothetical protein KatS3mg102_2901 [Planctomycetota bacterium]
MIHPSTELRYISDAIGYGVVATAPIPCGTIVWVRDAFDVTITPARYAALAPEYRAILRKYAYIDRRGHYVLCWDLARYMNHSCEANCLSPGYEFELAVRDIAPGEQLTGEYGALNLEAHMECRCGSPRCRGIIRPDDVVRYAAEWDAQLQAAIAHLRAVPQPLWPLVREKREIELALADPTRLASIRCHYRAPLAERMQRAVRRCAGGRGGGRPRRAGLG